MKFNDQQSEALKKVFKWIKKYRTSTDRTYLNNNQIFRLFGHAGTGKTTLAKYIAEAIINGENGIPAGEVLFAAYTGKAAFRLYQKGCENSSTVHSLIYKPNIDEETGKVLGYTLNYTGSPLRSAALLILDEVSFVDETMAKDVLSFGTPVLCLGDPGQLPPVKGEGYFINAQPDYMLTDIARQAKDNPIIYLATLARKGEKIKPGKYGESLILPYGSDFEDEMLLESDQILCGTNDTRRSLNARYRKLKGLDKIDPFYPTKGERLICLKNNKDNGLLNGMQWKCSTPVRGFTKYIANYSEYKRSMFSPAPVAAKWETSKVPALNFHIKSVDGMKDDSGKPLILRDLQVSCHLFNYNLGEPEYRYVASCEDFAFAYVITTHKFQGSEADWIVAKDESYVFRDAKFKHLYTTITRAAVKLTMIL